MQHYITENKDRNGVSSKKGGSDGRGPNEPVNIHTLHNAPYVGPPNMTSGVLPSMPETKSMPKKQLAQLPPLSSDYAAQMAAVPGKKLQSTVGAQPPYSSGPASGEVVPLSMPLGLTQGAHTRAAAPSPVSALQLHPQAVTAASRVGVLASHGKKIPTAQFLLGGPGSGVETQAALICQEYALLHISILDLYLAEWRSGSPAGKVIAQSLGLPPCPQVGLYSIEGESISAGVAPADVTDVLHLPVRLCPPIQYQAVPPHISVCLLQNVIEFHSRKGRYDFLITGYPASLPDWEAWSLAMGDYCQVAGVIWLDCPLDTQKDALQSEATDMRTELLHTVMSNVCVDVRERDCLQYMRDNVTIVCSYPTGKTDNANGAQDNSPTSFAKSLTTSGSTGKLGEPAGTTEYTLQVLLPEFVVVQACLLFSQNTVLRDQFVAAGRIKLVDSARPPLQVFKSLAVHLQPFKHLAKKKIQKGTDIWSSNQKPTVILLMGGPGAGCTTMTERILYKYRQTEIDVAALVRVSQGGTEDDIATAGKSINKNKKGKKPLSPEVLVELIQSHIEELMLGHDRFHFLIRGFPTNQACYNAFTSSLLPLINLKMIMLLDCPEHIRRQRLIALELDNSIGKGSTVNLIARNASSNDLRKPTLTQQQAESRVAPKLQRFLLHTSPVISEMIHVGNFVTVDSAKSADAVWHQVDAVLKEKLPGVRNFAFAPLSVLNPHMTRIVHGNTDDLDSESPKAVVVWLLGGPGSGRRRMAARLCRDFVLHPIIVHELHLRVVHKGSPEEREIAMRCLSDGAPLPAALTARLIKQEILLQMRRSNRKAFLLIGSTERLEDLDSWQLELNSVTHVSHAIHLTASHKVRMQRKTVELRGRPKVAEDVPQSPNHGSGNSDNVVVDVEAARLLRVDMTRYSTVTVPLIREVLLHEPGAQQPTFFANTCAVLPPAAAMTGTSGKPLGFGVVEVPSDTVSEAQTYAAVKASFTHLRMLSTEYARKMQAFSTPERPSVLLVAGPPGAGSSIVTKYIQQHYQVECLDVEYVLQQACLRNTADGNLVQYLRKTGQTVPAETIVNQMQQIIMQKFEEGSRFFVVSNFPSHTGDWAEWRRCIEPLADIVAIVILDCPENVCAQRLDKESKEDVSLDPDVVDTTALKNANEVSRTNWPGTNEHAQRRKHALAALEPVLRQYVDVKHKHTGVYERNDEKIVIESPPMDIIRILHTNVPEQKMYANLSLILADMHWLLRKAIEVRASCTSNPLSNRVIMQKIRDIEDEEADIRQKERVLLSETDQGKTDSNSRALTAQPANVPTDNVESGVAQVLLICGAPGCGAEFIGTMVSQLYDITTINVEALVRQFAYSDSVEALTLPSHVTFGANSDDSSIITAQASVQAQLRESVRAALKQGYGVNPNLIMALVRNRVRHLRDQQGIHRYVVCGLPLAWNEQEHDVETSTWRLWYSDVAEHGIELCGVITLDVPYSALRQRVEQSESINAAMAKNADGTSEDDSTQSPSFIALLNAKLALLKSSQLPQLERLPVELYEQFDSAYATKYRQANEGVAVLEQSEVLEGVAPFLFKRVVSASPCGASQLHRTVEFVRKVFPGLVLSESGKQVKLPPRPSTKQDQDDVKRALLLSAEDKEMDTSTETPQNQQLSRVLGSDIVQKGRVAHMNSSSIHLLHQVGSAQRNTSLPLPLPHQPTALAEPVETVAREPALQVILLSGAPGCGAVALGAKLEYMYDMLFLNVDDLIRACVLSSHTSPQSRVLIPLIANGMLPPAEIVVHIVLAALREARKQRHYHVCQYGFPNSLDALAMWDKLLSPIANIVLCLYVEASPAVASQRTLEEWHRVTGLPAQAGVISQVEIDGVETAVETGPVRYPVPGDADWQGVACTPAALRQQIENFTVHTLPALQSLSQRGIVVKVSGDEPTDILVQRATVALRRVNYHVSLSEYMRLSGLVVQDHVSPQPHLCIFVVGPRASGKTSICSSLAQMYSLQHVVVNELILKEIMVGSPYGNEFRQSQEKQEQYPATLVVDVVRRHVVESMRALGQEYQQFHKNYIKVLLALENSEDSNSSNNLMKEKLITEATRTLSKLRTPVFLIDGLPTSAETVEAVQLLFGRDGSDPYVLNIVASQEKCNSNLAKAKLAGETYMYRNHQEDSEWEEGARLIIQAAEASTCGGMARTARIRDGDSLEAAIMVRVGPALEDILSSVMLLNARAIAALVSFHLLHSPRGDDLHVVSAETHNIDAIEAIATDIITKKNRLLLTNRASIDAGLEEYKDVMDDIALKSQVALTNRAKTLKEQSMLQEQLLALESSSIQLLHSLQASSGPDIIAKHTALLSSDSSVAQFLTKASKIRKPISFVKPIAANSNSRIAFQPPTAGIIPIFLLGTPLSGKSTLATTMALNLNVVHLNVSTLLYMESRLCNARANIIADFARVNRRPSPGLVVDVLKSYISQYVLGGRNVFLIENFPLSTEEWCEWNRQLSGDDDRVVMLQSQYNAVQGAMTDAKASILGPGVELTAKGVRHSERVRVGSILQQAEEQAMRCSAVTSHFVVLETSSAVALERLATQRSNTVSTAPNTSAASTATYEEATAATIDSHFRMYQQQTLPMLRAAASLLGRASGTSVAFLDGRSERHVNEASMLSLLSSIICNVESTPAIPQQRVPAIISPPSSTSNNNANHTTMNFSIFPIFLVGGPGAGKLTLASRLAQTLGVAHIDPVALLEAEVVNKTRFASKISECARNGSLVPGEITAMLVIRAITTLAETQKRVVVIINGFPTCMESWGAWTQAVADQAQDADNPQVPLGACLHLDCPRDVRVRRLVRQEEQATSAKKGRGSSSSSQAVPSSLTARLGHGTESSVSYTRGASASIEKATWNHEHTTLYAEHALQHSTNVFYHITNSAEPLEGVVAKASFWIATLLSTMVIAKQQVTRLSALGPFYSAESIPVLPQLAPAFSSLCSHISHLLLSNSIAPAVVVHALSYNPSKAPSNAMKSALVPIDILKANSTVFSRFASTAPAVRHAVAALDAALSIKGSQTYSLTRPTPQILHVVGPVGCGALHVAEAIATSYEIVVIDAEALVQKHAQQELTKSRDREAGITSSSPDSPVNPTGPTATISLGSVSAALFVQLVQREMLSLLEERPHAANFVISNFPCSLTQWNQWIRVCRGNWAVRGVISVDCSEEYFVNALQQRGLSLERIAHVIKDYNVHTLPLLSSQCRGGANSDQLLTMQSDASVPSDVFVVPVNAAQPVSSILQMIEVNLSALKLPVITKNTIVPVSITQKPSLDAELIRLHNTPLVLFVHGGPGSGVEHVLSTFLRNKLDCPMMHDEALADAQLVSIDMNALCIAESKKDTTAGALLRHSIARGQPVPPFISAGLLRTFIWEHMTRTVLRGGGGNSNTAHASTHGGSHLNNIAAKSMSAVKCVYFVVGYSCDIASMEAWCKIASVSSDLTDIYSQVHSLWFSVDEKLRIANLLRMGEMKHVLLAKTARYNTAKDGVQEWCSSRGVTVTVNTRQFHSSTETPVQAETAMPHLTQAIDALLRASVAQRKLALHNQLARADADVLNDVSDDSVHLLCLLSSDVLAAQSITAALNSQFRCQPLSFTMLTGLEPEKYSSAIAGATLVYRTMQFIMQHDNVRHFVLHGFPRSKDDIQAFNSVSANTVKMQFSVLNGVTSSPKVLSDGTVVTKLAMPSYTADILVYAQKTGITTCQLYAPNVLRGNYFYMRNVQSESSALEAEGKQYLLDSAGNSDKTSLLLPTRQGPVWTQLDTLGESIVADHHLRYVWGSALRYRSHTPAMTAIEALSRKTVSSSGSSEHGPLSTAFLLSLTGNAGHLLSAECMKLHQSHHFAVQNVGVLRAFLRVLSCVQLAVEEGNIKTLGMVAAAAKAVGDANVQVPSRSSAQPVLTSLDMATQTLRQCLDGGLLVDSLHTPEFSPATAPSLSSILETILLAGGVSHLSDVKASAMQYLGRNGDLDVVILRREAHALCLVVFWLIQYASLYSHAATTTRLHTKNLHSIRVVLTGQFPTQTEAVQWQQVSGFTVDESLFKINLNVPSHVAQARAASDTVLINNSTSGSTSTDHIYNLVTSEQGYNIATVNRMLDIAINTSTSSTDIGIQINNWLAVLEDVDKSHLDHSIALIHGNKAASTDEVGKTGTVSAIVTARIGTQQLPVFEQQETVSAKKEAPERPVIGSRLAPRLQFQFTSLSASSFAWAVPALLPKLPSIAGVIFVVGPAGSHTKSACSHLSSHFDVSWFDMSSLVFDSCAANPKGSLAKAVRRLLASKSLSLDQNEDTLDHFTITPFNVGITLTHLPPALLVSVLVSAIYDESSATQVNSSNSSTNSMLHASRKWFLVSDFPATLATWAAWRATALSRNIASTKVMHFNAEPLHSILSVHPPLRRAAQEDAFRHVKEEHERKKVQLNADLMHLRDKLHDKAVVAQPLLRTFLATWFSSISSNAKLRADTLTRRVDAECVAAEANIAAAALEDVDLELSENARVLADMAKHLVLFNASCSNVPQAAQPVFSMLRVHRAAPSGGLSTPIAQATASNYGAYPVFDSALPVVLPVAERVPRGDSRQLSEIVETIIRSEVGQRYVFVLSYNEFIEGQNNHVCTATVTGNDLISCQNTGSLIVPLVLLQGYSEKQPYLVLTPGSIAKVSVSGNILEARASEIRSRTMEMRSKYQARIDKLRAVEAEYNDKYNSMINGGDLMYNGEDVKTMYEDKPVLRVSEFKSTVDLLGDVSTAQDSNLDEQATSTHLGISSPNARLAFRAYCKFIENTENDEEQVTTLTKEQDVLNHTVIDEHTQHPLNEAKVLDMLAARDKDLLQNYVENTLPLCKLLRHELNKTDYVIQCPHDAEQLRSASDVELGLDSRLCIAVENLENSSESNALFEDLLVSQYPAQEHIRLSGESREKKSALNDKQEQDQNAKSLVLTADERPLTATPDSSSITGTELKSNASQYNSLTFITGGPGCGKTSLALALKQQFPDIAVLDAISLANSEAIPTNNNARAVEETERLIISSLLRRATALRAQNVRRFVITGFPQSHNGWSEFLKEPSVVRAGKSGASSQKPSSVFAIQKVIILDVNNNNRLQRLVKKTKNIRNAQLTIKNYESHGKNVELRIKQEEPLSTVVVDANAPISVVLEQVAKLIGPPELKKD